MFNTRALYFNRQSRGLSLAANKQAQAQSHSKSRYMQIQHRPRSIPHVQNV